MKQITVFIFKVTAVVVCAFLLQCTKEQTKLNPNLAVISSANVDSIYYNSALASASISSEGGSAVTERGFCYSTNANPSLANSKIVNGKGLGNYISNIPGLLSNTKYYVKAYATNSFGTSYGSELNFTLYMNSPGPSLTDIEGNIYKTVRIGRQTWMAENLKTTKYNDNTAIPLVTDNVAWSNLTTSAYCWYNNDITNKTTYGALYNGYTVNTKKLCPSGWHVPTYTEYYFLGSYLIEWSPDWHTRQRKPSGGLLKEAGTTHWISPNTGATNSTGFTGLPGGIRYGKVSNLLNSGSFTNLGTLGYWYAIADAVYLEQLPNTTLLYFTLFNDSAWERYAGAYLTIGASGATVRCIKD
jgi:uncharacterized protein (TIGR02145 family)